MRYPAWIKNKILICYFEICFFVPELPIFFVLWSSTLLAYIFPENQQTIHLLCEGLHERSAPGWWWGLEFYNSSIKVVTTGHKKINESASVLEYVDIMYAGKCIVIMLCLVSYAYHTVITTCCRMENTQSFFPYQCE